MPPKPFSWNETPLDCLAKMTDHQFFRREEIQDLFSKKENVAELIKRKQKALRIDGNVWFLGQANKRESTALVSLPKAELGIERNGKIITSREDKSHYDPVVFTSYIPELSWSGFGGHGVGLHLDLKLGSLIELQRFLRLVHSQVELSSDGAFTISQQQCCWRGFGIENLLHDIGRWQKRYSESQIDYVHHSEDFHYFDLCRSGFVLLSGRQQVEQRVHVYQCEIDFILPGIPVELRPFLRICEASGHYEPTFVPLTDPQSESFYFRPPIPVEPICRIVSLKKSREELVCGLIVKNPFKKRKKLIPAGKVKYSCVARLGSPEYLVCELSDWHNPDDEISRYHLTRLHATQIGEAAIFNPAATWETILSRKPAPPNPRQISEFWKKFGAAPGKSGFKKRSKP